MIKKPTLIVLVCAIVLGGVYYYLNYRDTKAAKSSPSIFKSAFTIKPADVNSITVSRPSTPNQPPIRFDRNGGNWQIAQPTETAADSSVVDQSLGSVVSSEVVESEPDTPDRIKAFGLDPGQLSVTMQMKTGAKHTLLIGDKIFDGSSVYAIIDGAKSVSVLPDSARASFDKSLDDFRDHTVLHITSDQVASFTLKNPSGDLAADKKSADNKDQWMFTKPVEARADQDSINSLLMAVQNAKFPSVASEKPDDLAKYGLSSPSVSLTTKDDTGKTLTLIVGKKDGNNYFARDTSRPMIFDIPGDLYTQISKKFMDLRDKKVLHFDAADLTRIEVHNDHGTMVASSKAPDTWTVESPDAQKGKTAANLKLIDPLSDLQSDQIVDHPGADLTSKLANPAIDVTFTDKNKKTVDLKISKPIGDVVYAQSSESPAVYKLTKQDFDKLDFEAAALAQ